MMHFITSTTILGFGLDAYIIVVLLAIPIFFFWRWLFKKFIVVRTKRRILTWLTTIFSAPLVYFLIVVIWVLSWNYYPNHDFNKTEWADNKDERYEYVDNIIDSKMLIGKTKAEVQKLLGDEGNKQDSDDWFYDLGFTPSSIDPDSMEIEFKNGKVENVIRHEHH
jgi:hypothetical protein